MIVGVGIDSVEIDRFKKWCHYTKSTLNRLFSSQEINYCLSNPQKSAERFAARFAAREAFFKALCSMLPDYTIPFLTVCKKIGVDEADNGSRKLIIDWDSLLSHTQGLDNKNSISNFISITHTKTTVTVLVVLEKLSK